MQNNFSEITLLHGCSPVNLLYIFRTVSYMITSRGLLLNIVTNKRERREIKRFSVILFCLFIFWHIYFFSILFLVKLQNFFTTKQLKPNGNFKLKAGYTTEEKTVWRFCVNKNYSRYYQQNQWWKREKNCMFKLLFFLF